VCLSTVYSDKKDLKNIVLEEASSIVTDGSGITVRTLFGEQKVLAGYSVGEVNLLEHYVIVHKKEGHHG
jgi:predicted RNA-binding protein